MFRKNIEVKSNDKTTTIIQIALRSRLILIVLQFVSNHLIPDHDASDVFLSPKSQLTNSTLFDRIVDSSLNGFQRWDAQYFLHIAKYGYTYENCLAFFPFYPLVIRYLSLLLYNQCYFSYLLTYDSVLLSSCISCNLIVFILAALALYDLTLIVCNNDKEFAFKATILFCYNPASIFFTAPYTETFYSFLTFKSMLYCLRFYQQQSPILTIKIVLTISLSILTRSNGILNIGFIVYTLITICLRKFRNCFNELIKFSLITCSIIFSCLLPFLMFQWFSYRQFCRDFQSDLPEIIRKYADLKGFKLPGNFRNYNQSWCLKLIPFAYSHVQETYWNVGFFNYYQLKQIPNFLLALPMISIILMNSLRYFRQYFYIVVDRKTSIFRLIFNLSSKKLMGIDYLNSCSFVFIVHGCFLMFFCIFNIHIQVITRILCSASPIFYWFCLMNVPKLSTIETKLPLFKFDPNPLYFCYFNCFYIVGTIMFCNFLPWT